MQPILTTAEDLCTSNFSCHKCGHEFTDEEIEEAITELSGEPFNGTILVCPDGDDQEKCDSEYSLDMKILIREL